VTSAFAATRLIAAMPFFWRLLGWITLRSGDDLAAVSLQMEIKVPSAPLKFSNLPIYSFF
jgi:hypothetical protein